ncbi:MAG TPA: DinB family protein [Rhodothermales bacterium]|nr:DinB family protein [Rhodothermales bacterium]
MATEAWLRGPLEGVDPYLMPAAHTLVQVKEEIEGAATGLSTDQLWVRPGGAASVGFHLRHLAGSTDRLLTYARGEQLRPEQMASLAAEGEPGEPPEDVAALLAGALAALERALDVIRATPRDALLEAREVGRARLPSTVMGLLFHVAAHAQRHAGQVVTTAKIVRGMELGG